MEKKNIDWAGLGFEYIQTDKRFVANYKNGVWEEGGLTEEAAVIINECAGVLQYSQSCFEGLKAYTTEDGRIVTFRPDLNGQRMEDSCRRLEMPVLPKEKFVDAVIQTVKANEAYYLLIGWELPCTSDHLCLPADRVSVVNRRMNISSEFSPHRLVPISKGA